MTARAGSQKVINMGTKVKSATGNTVVSQECQDAYYGCMDAFCMLDNTSGGRCQCSDRNAELMKVMDDIAKLDEQSYAMATEGVERIQMGENADTIIANAKAAAEKVSNQETAEDVLNNFNGIKVDNLELRFNHVKTYEEKYTSQIIKFTVKKYILTILFYFLVIHWKY